MELRKQLAWADVDASGRRTDPPALIRGLRIPVATVVAMVADDMTPDNIVAELPDLQPEDIAEALRYAAEVLRERQLPLQPV